MDQKIWSKDMFARIWKYLTAPYTYYKNKKRLAKRKKKISKRDPFIYD